MEVEIDRIMDELCRHVNLSADELREIRENFPLYEEAMGELLRHASINMALKGELSRLSSEEARLNYESYETYMSVHANSIAISGHRGAIRISGQNLSRDIESEIEELLSKYIPIKF